MTAPRTGTRGIYRSPYSGETGFDIVRVEGNLCWARYDNLPNETQPFIWRHPDGLNTLHDWQGNDKTHERTSFNTNNRNDVRVLQRTALDQ